jgi:hypothetical protein
VSGVRSRVCGSGVRSQASGLGVESRVSGSGVRCLGWELEVGVTLETARRDTQWLHTVVCTGPSE